MTTNEKSIDLWICLLWTITLLASRVSTRTAKYESNENTAQIRRRKRQASCIQTQTEYENTPANSNRQKMMST